jgi:hypothetical protein
LDGQRGISLPNMTPKGMLLDASVLIIKQNKYKKTNKNLILIRLVKMLLTK